MSWVMAGGKVSFFIALTLGFFFIFFAFKYYISILIVLFNNGGRGNNRTNTHRAVNLRSRFTKDVKQQENDTGNINHFYESRQKHGNQDEPFVSIQLPFYNERNVARRIVQTCGTMDYTNYEVVVVDDSRDETVDILKELNGEKRSPTIKFVHRRDRTGFKGGALQKAVEFMDPRTEYVVVLDADFIPPRDLIRRFLRYFENQDETAGKENRDEHGINNQKMNQRKNGKKRDDLRAVPDSCNRNRVAVVQGYQLHNLNKDENWITRGVRAEFSGSYMIERVAQEFYGALKMIAGSVFMIKADVLRMLGWTDSITEDWDLTLRMYQEGYKVLYTPLVQASAEIPTTIRVLIRQRMRWAEGHTFAVKKYFRDIMKSRNLNLREKLEFLYYTPYYLQSFFLLVGTICWIVADLVGWHPPFWTVISGWCLILINFSALPLMSLAGLYLEWTTREDFTGIFSFILLSYILAPFQAFAALKGLVERDEGMWIRTLKTGSITNRRYS